MSLYVSFTDKRLLHFLFLSLLVIQLELEKKEYAVFESDDYVEVCLIAKNTQSTSCPVSVVIYYSVHTFGGNASKEFFPSLSVALVKTQFQLKDRTIIPY